MKTKLIALTTSLIIAQTALAALGPIPKEEDISGLLEGKREITSLGEAELLGLNSGATSIDLWSGSYWPLYQGSLGSRYREPNFAALIAKDVQFKEYKDLVSTQPVYSVRDSSTLSPSEKYDLLVGDPLMSLTKYSWENSEKTAVNEKVPTWRGLCDGWASASQMMPRPVKPVTVSTPSGAQITFTHDDIKALGSLLYARNQGAPIFLGKRCRSPLLDVNGACAETNPGAFHRALINRVGNLKKTFISDIAPGTEVWNYPVKSYKVSYYNPFTQQDFDTYQSAMESFDKKKKFKNVNARHKDTKFIVGVETRVIFTEMRPASTELNDDRSHEKILEKKYDYDLELDGNGNILGGVSMSKNLPDFIWAPNDTTYPKGFLEKNKTTRSPEELVKLSQDSAKTGQPLASIVKSLFEASKD